MSIFSFIGKVFQKDQGASLIIREDRPGEAEWLAQRYGSSSAGAMIKGREVSIWRPPAMLTRDGATMQGVSKELIANYLVATTGALADSQLGAVSVTWTAQEGRFATTTLSIHSWGTEVSMLHPIAPINQELMASLELYRTGIIDKVRELHKGRQRFGQANQSIQVALEQIHDLRDNSPVPQFSDPEFMFIVASMSEGLTMSALIPANSDMGISSETVFSNDGGDPYRYTPTSNF
jgi:hypothetical protein